MTTQTTYNPIHTIIPKGKGFASISINDTGAPRLFAIDLWGAESCRMAWTLAAAGFAVRIHHPVRNHAKRAPSAS